MKKKEYSIDIDGKTLTAEFTDLADQANGSVILRMGDTAIIATATMGSEREGMPYFPLSVEFEEKFYAAGAILGSQYMRREGRPTDEAVLAARAIDRTIRPLFEQHIRRDIQIVVTVLSLGEYDPDVLGIVAASLALATSDIPWNGPVSAVRIGSIEEDTMETNPSYETREKSESIFDMIACGKEGNINMIEVGASEKTEDFVASALAKASEEIEKIQKFQENIIKEIGKEKQVIAPRTYSENMIALYEEIIAPKLKDKVFSKSGKDGINDLKKEFADALREKFEDENVSDASEYYEHKVDELLHTEAIDNDARPDGRGMDDVRELYAQAGNFSPRAHGTGIFYRGGTHIFSALTLGGPGDALALNTIENQHGKKRYMHHYNFPPFSVGEAGRVGGFNRRMIGHGALAEKALLPVLPTQEEFPYTIRIVSESMASNGSTSQASVCGSSLALMDAGVPIKRPVAGIASGLMMNNENEYKVLTDIQGPEDHHGDMDLKVSGTRIGITAIQMDVKVNGIPLAILTIALEKAKLAREKILDVIEAEIKEPRKKISKYAPEILSLMIKPEQIGLVIGPGGKMINSIRDETGVLDINIEDSGMIFITGLDGSASLAKAKIEALTKIYKAGEKYTGLVTKIMDFGAFVKIGPNTEGLVHISEMAPFRIENINDILKEGAEVPIVVKEIDEKKRINLSIKQTDPHFFDAHKPKTESQA